LIALILHAAKKQEKTELKVLFIGGTGVISSACSALCVERGFDLWLLNRGKSFRPPPTGAKLIRADIRETAEVRSALARLDFDVVVDWIAYEVGHVRTDAALFKDKTAQYVFISSATVYQKPPQRLPITESTVLHNPYWDYAGNKIACEEYLVEAFKKEGFPVTIVRPSHTYDKTMVPFHGGYTVIERMKKGKKVIVHGDGTSLWTLTHHKDFAKGLVGLLGNDDAIGESYHITSDELLTWNQIFQITAEALDVTPRFVHVPSDFINRFDREWGSSLLGDKAHSMIFDNSKIKKTVPDFGATIPFSTGVREIIDWYEADESRQVINEKKDRVMDLIIERFESITNR
jgi:nucleoside-diphosphate-sugar epimerase